MYDTDQYFADLYYDDRSKQYYCPECALYHHEEERHDELDMCAQCGAKREAALFAERADNFQWLSKGWFQREVMQAPLHVLADRDEAMRKAGGQKSDRKAAA